jgi:hypothetical protein
MKIDMTTEEWIADWLSQHSDKDMPDDLLNDEMLPLGAVSIA